MYQLHKDNVLEKVNSYSQLDAAIAKYGGKNTTSKEYSDKTGATFEVFNLFWMLKFGHHADICVNNITDTSANKNNRGYDFKFIDNNGLVGLIQTKWRNYFAAIQKHVKYKCVLMGEEMLTNDDEYSDVFRAYPDYKPRDKNNILFINFDADDKLFDTFYSAKKKPRYVIDRKKQEFYIKSDPNFWDDFRKAIANSCEIKFVDAPTLRDVQRWISEGTIKTETDGVFTRTVNYLGTDAVVFRKIHKGRIEAAPATGKTLSIHNIVLKVFETGRNLVIVVIPWRPLVSQTFMEFYKWKMFGYLDANNNPVHTKIVPILAMSGDSPNYNPIVMQGGEPILMSTNIDTIAGKIISNYTNGLKTVLFITDKSMTNDYDDKMIENIDNYEEFLNSLDINHIKSIMNFESLFGILFNKGFTPDMIFEIYDEFHNLIPTIANNSKDSKNREELEEYASRLLLNMDIRNSGTLFYSASNKGGAIIDSYNIKQFGPLLCKVTRQDLAERGYVCPNLIIKIIKVKTEDCDKDDAREAALKGVSLRKTQNEAAGIVVMFNDMIKNHCSEPNALTFGSHVAGCKFIATDETFQGLLPNTKIHFMSADTKNSERDMIFNIIANSGNNILNQHSVAQEGVNIPNFHCSLIARGMGFLGLQQAIGRVDRVLFEDYIKLIKGEISLDSPEGWKKYSNVVYVVINDNENMKDRVKDLVKYLRYNGIPREKWQITFVDDSSRVDTTNPIVYKQEGDNVNFTDEDLQDAINSCDIEILGEIEAEDNRLLKVTINSTDSYTDKLSIIVGEDFSDVDDKYQALVSAKNKELQPNDEPISSQPISEIIDLNMNNILDDIDLGSKIEHKKFGIGIITNINATMLTIYFDKDNKTRTIDSKLAPITAL